MMAKYHKFNRTDLTPVQIQARAERRKWGHIVKYGISQPKGTQPRWPVTGEPLFKPMPSPVISPLELAYSFLSLFPWFRRRRREEELWQERESQSIKDKGVK